MGGIIEINLLALTNTATRKKQVIAADIPGMAAYGPCARIGEFLLPSGLMAIGHDGDVAGKTVSPGFAALSHGGYTQAATVYEYAEALCRIAGRFGRHHCHRARDIRVVPVPHIDKVREVVDPGEVDLRLQRLLQ